MARPPLPRYAGDVIVAVELAAHDEADALRRATELEDVVRRAVTAAVRNHGSRTARVTAVTLHNADLGADAMSAV